MANDGGHLKGHGFVGHEKPDRTHEELAIAIVRQAVSDHWEYHRQLRMWERKEMDPDQSQSVCRQEIRRLKGCLHDIKTFFYSQHFQLLCSFDGPVLWKAIERNWREGRQLPKCFNGPRAGHSGRKGKQ